MLHPVHLGSLTQLWAGTMPEALNHNAGVSAVRSSWSVHLAECVAAMKFLIPWARVDKCRKEAYDDALGERLWNALEEAVKDK